MATNERASMDEDKQRDLSKKGGEVKQTEKKAEAMPEGDDADIQPPKESIQPPKESIQPPKESKPKERGFAAMDPAKQREIASKGGKAAHEKGVAPEFTPEQAREAGRKGGEAVSKDREHMSEIGSKGAEARNRDR